MTAVTGERRVTMVDYGGSNMRSVQKAFEAVGVAIEVTSDPEVARRAVRLVLPGVGAFRPGMDALRSRGLDGAIVDDVAAGTPLLGICLGMQLLFAVSEEMGRHKGLGLLPGQVVAFVGRPPTANAPGLKVPHMGWNRIRHEDQHPLLAGVPNGSYAYFVHSYYCAPANPQDILATTDYGVEFAAIVGRGRLYGIQFHPEKSQRIGLAILRNFAQMETG